VGFNVVSMILDLAGGVGVEAHLGGFVCGLTAGLALVLLRVVQSTAWEQNLVELLKLSWWR
jgi:membrane associated rhomboid family serine protease